MSELSHICYIIVYNKIYSLYGVIVLQWASGGGVSKNVNLIFHVCKLY